MIWRNYISAENRLFLMESEEIRIDELISYLEEAKKKIDEIELQLFRLKAERIEEEETGEAEAREISELTDEALKKGRPWSEIRDEL
jgi:Mg2+ and Co2+ transporter CorA